MIKRGERTFVVVLILFSTAAFWQAFQISGFSKLASPGVFPMLASATMIISALFILFGERTSDVTPDVLPTLPARVGVITLLLVLYIIAMPALGFLVCSGLFLFASISYLWTKPLWLSLLISIVALLIIHLIFRLAFQVILPQGTLITQFY